MDKLKKLRVTLILGIILVGILIFREVTICNSDPNYNPYLFFNTNL